LLPEGDKTLSRLIESINKKKYAIGQKVSVMEWTRLFNGLYYSMLSTKEKFYEADKT